MSPPPIPIVVALGGNAISRPREEGNITQQFAHARDTAEHLVRLIERGYLPVVTHGNGPQVGNVLRRVELAAGEIYPIPLHICVADTQAGMGFMICQCLDNALRRRGLARNVVSLVTTVEVDPADPAFATPTKPIGKSLSQAQAFAYAEQYGWKMKAFGDDEYRRVVASPPPRTIREIGPIRHLVGQGDVVVAAGGGGIAVARDAAGDWKGVDCVVDKDLTSALLAAELGVSTLVIATGVDHVMLNFGKPDARALDSLTVGEARRHMAEGQFPPGTLGPKIEAALLFLERSSRAEARVLIVDLDHISEGLEGRAGTWLQND